MSVPPNRKAVLVLGAFGTFGRRILDALARSTRLRIIAAGRHVPQDLPSFGHGVSSLAIDGGAIDSALLRKLNAGLVIDTVGPFHERDRKLAEACIDSAIHYVDLADGREFVRNVAALDAAARDRDVLIVSGASTVPALSSAVIERLAREFLRVAEIDIGIAPGCAGPQGLATIRSVLAYAGRMIPVWRDSRMKSARGWGGNARHRYPKPVGLRNLALIDVPDTGLLPACFPGLDRLTIRAGHEVSIVHHALRILAALVKAGLLRDLSAHAHSLQRAAGWFNRFGTGNGAMHVTLSGLGHDGSSLIRTWTLIAENGDGPQVPATAAVLIAKKLLQVPGYAPITIRGARPAINLLTLAEFEREWRALAIRTSVASNASAGACVDPRFRGSSRRAT